MAPDLAGEAPGGRELRSTDELRPRAFDQVLYQLGNERHHAFMQPLVRAIGGTVALHDWVLFDLAVAAHPALTRTGPRGLAVALREGGLRQAAVWWRNRMLRRAQRSRALELSQSGLDGCADDEKSLPVDLVDQRSVIEPGP